MLHCCSIRYNKKRLQVKDQLLSGTIDYLLEFGLAGLSLRPLAKKLGTSDRMILYYFETKDALIQEAVEKLADQMILKIKQRCLEYGIKSPADFIECVWDAFVDPASRPIAMLFLEIDLLSLREAKTFGNTGKFLMEEWSQLVSSNISPFVGSGKEVKQRIDGLSAELLGAIVHHLVSQGNSPKGTLKRVRERANAMGVSSLR